MPRISQHLVTSSKGNIPYLSVVDRHVVQLLLHPYGWNDPLTIWILHEGRCLVVPGSILPPSLQPSVSNLIAHALFGPFGGGTTLLVWSWGGEAWHACLTTPYLGTKGVAPSLVLLKVVPGTFIEQSWEALVFPPTKISALKRIGSVFWPIQPCPPQSWSWCCTKIDGIEDYWWCPQFGRDVVHLGFLLKHHVLRQVTDLSTPQSVFNLGRQFDLCSELRPFCSC